MSEYTGIRVAAPAKVNLYLKVVGKRPDGYHNLVSVMQALELADIVEVYRADPGVIEVDCDVPGVPAGPGNIAYRAAESLLRASGSTRGVRIHITKNTPMAAGLGGGSSDAAAALRAVDLLFELSTSAETMHGLATALGADVPFFLGWPTSLARGIGEELSELVPPAETWLLLVNPGIAVPTKWVYDNLNLGLTNNLNSTTLPPFVGCPLTDGPMLSFLHNDLESVTLGRHPVIKEIKDRLSELGAAGSMMSGSGPTVFGIFRSREDAERAAGGVKGEGWRVIPTRTLARWPEPEFIS
ncbi:MAG TPA: 4-(cytidine 5'-diphospho)-2-C-methyl-D-erythritol kinase [Nitrospirota bacterium]